MRQRSSGPNAHATERPWAKWARAPLNAILVTLLAAGGIITFVAAVGGAIIWVRFSAARLPADQILAVMPRGQLVASGGILLAILLVLAILSVVGLSMFQEQIMDDRATPVGVVRGLIVLVAAESIVIVALVEASWARRIVAGELIVLAAMLMFLILRWRDSLSSTSRLPWRGAWRALGDLVVGFVARPVWREKEGGRDVTRISLGWLVVFPTLVAVGIGLAVDHQNPEEVQQKVLAGALAWSVAVLGWAWLANGSTGGKPSGDPDDDDLPTAFGKRFAKFASLSLAFATAGGAALVLGEPWVAITLPTAIVLGVVSWRIARASEYSFVACGVAVFVSVPLFGGVAAAARNFFDPQVQPVALLKSGDNGRDEPLRGIYVTETDERVYYATIGTEDNPEAQGGLGEEPRDQLAGGSGRLQWVAREKIKDMSTGPPQSVTDAAIEACTMSLAQIPVADGGAADARIRPRRGPGRRRGKIDTQFLRQSPVLRVERLDLERECERVEASVDDR
jgi:hypothetical protein